MSTVIERAPLSENWWVCLAPESNDEFAEEFESNCGILLGGVLWVARKLFQYDVMKELVYPLCGDWAQLGISSRAWMSVQAGTMTISGNFDEMANLPQDVWADDGTDKTPEAFRARMATLATNFGHYGTAAELTSQLVDNLIEVGKAAAEGIALIISLISETLERIAVEMAIPVVGWAVGAVETGVFIKRFWDRANKAIKLIEKVLKTIEKVITALDKIIKVMKILKTMLALFNGTMALGNSINTPTAVEHGYGVA